MLSEDFWSKVNKTDGCWLWTGRGNPDNYGLYSMKRKPHRVHILAWEESNGPVPPGMVLDHVCHTNECLLRSQCPHRRCVRLDHLRVTTVKINILRGVGPTAINGAKVQCSYGHPYNDENTYWKPNGERDCRPCQRRRQASYTAAARQREVEAGALMEQHSEVAAGDVFTWGPVTATVTRVSKTGTWVDIACRNIEGATWGKRMRAGIPIAWTRQARSGQDGSAR